MDEEITWEAIDQRIAAAVNEIIGALAAHTVDLDPHGLVKLRGQVQQHLAVSALPPLRTDDFAYPDGPLTTWTQYIRQPSVLDSHLVAPVTDNGLPYGITMAVTAPLQRIVAAVSFSASGNVRLILRDGTDDAAVISVESTGLVIQRRADLSEVTRLSLFELLPAMTDELLCDFSVIGQTVSLNVNGVPIHTFETAGTTGDAVSVALTNGGRVNSITIFGAAA